MFLNFYMEFQFATHFGEVILLLVTFCYARGFFSILVELIFINEYDLSSRLLPLILQQI